MTNKSKKRTLKDVAKLAGVSTSTVSLVLQNKGNIKQETRENINKIMDEIGYKRKSSCSVHTSQFALIVDDICNPYFHELYEGVESVLHESGALVSIFSSHDSLTRQKKILSDLCQTNIDGFALVPASGTTQKDLYSYKNRTRPFFLAVRRIKNTPIDYVGANPMIGMRLATDHLIALGHRKIGFVGGYAHNFAYAERYAGFTSSFMTHGVNLNLDYVIDGGSNRDFGRKITKQLLAREIPPTALIGYNDIVAIGVMDAIRASGLEIGKDVAVIGYDDIPEAALQPVPMTSVATPARELGKILGIAFKGWSANNQERDALEIMYPPKLIVRGSCGMNIESVEVPKKCTSG